MKYISKKNIIRSSVVLLLLLLLFQIFNIEAIAGKKKVSRKKPSGPPKYELVQDTLLSSGIVFKRLIVTIDGKKHEVNILQASLDNKDARVKVFKANKNISELSKLHDIIRYYDSLEHTDIKGAVNANFWRAYTNFPIGPVVIEGEIIEMLSYKQWSSMFINEFGEPFIDNFKINGLISQKKLRDFDISYVNRRKDTNGIVFYNKYGGHKIPYISPSKAKNLLETAIDNQSNEIDFNDSTEIEFDLEIMHQELIEMERTSSIEYNLPKVSLLYLNSPALNKNMYCRVISLDSQAVPMPENGCIISYGKDFNKAFLPKIGDTVLVRFSTNSNNKEVFVSAVCGTPRLVRNGTASHEARTEGSTGRRFISHQLPRTALGYNKSKTRMYLVAIKGNSSQEHTTGANLTQLANIMKYIGCYNAMNLDGGGSTLMVIDGKNVINRDNPNSSRRISVGIGISAEPGFESLINDLTEPKK